MTDRHGQRRGGGAAGRWAGRTIVVLAVLIIAVFRSDAGRNVSSPTTPPAATLTPDLPPVIAQAMEEVAACAITWLIRLPDPGPAGRASHAPTLSSPTTTRWQMPRWRPAPTTTPLASLACSRSPTSWPATSSPSVQFAALTGEEVDFQRARAFVKRAAETGTSRQRTRWTTWTCMVFSTARQWS